MKSTLYWEAKRHGTADFPVAYYRIDKKHPQYIMPLHRHREPELLRVLRGSLRLYINNIEYTAHPGDLFFIGSGDLHRAEPENCLYECVVFDLGLLGRPGSVMASSVQPLMLGQRQVECCLTDHHESLAYTANQLFTCLRDKPAHYSLAAHSLLSELVYRLHIHGCVHTPHGGRDEHQRIMVAEVLEWIDRNYTQRITLQTLSQVAAVHEKHLCRVFKEFTGQTPIDYVNQIRLEYACAALLRSHKSITEIALDCGFSDAGYFSRLFRRAKGMTPRAFRAGAART